MIRRLKLALTETYIGAIALGWLLAEDIMQFREPAASNQELKRLCRKGFLSIAQPECGCVSGVGLCWIDYE
jgi:hypothetical protein